MKRNKTRLVRVSEKNYERLCQRIGDLQKKEKRMVSVDDVITCFFRMCRNCGRTRTAPKKKPKSGTSEKILKESEVWHPHKRREII